MNEVCPSCGRFVDYLQERTGWCASCSHREGYECLACGERKGASAFSADRSRPSGRRPVCRQCDSKARRERTQRARAVAS